MPTCIECSTKTTFKTTKGLLFHLQVIHKFNVSSTYRCGEVGCQRKFPLGSHCSKIAGIYATIACLPPEIASRLENLFLSILFNGKDREEFTVKRIIAPLIHELEFLEKEGIIVTLSTGEEHHVYFVMGLLLEDNLGINQLCGFICNFSMSNYCCRFCKIHRNEMRFALQLDRSLIRNRHNYEQDVLLQNETETGIKQRCVFNESESYHVTDNLEGDILHDFDEGISHKVMTFIILNLTDNMNRCFSLEELNRRLNLFDFGTYSALYKTKLYITIENLRNGKLKMTGSEMQCFVRYFGILIGDKVLENNKYWQLYLCLQRVYDVVCKNVPESSIKSLQYYVKELGHQYLSLSENNLTFKFHKIICHYSSIMKESGPIVNLSVRRFESKHRELKSYANVNMSRVHLTKSLAIKHQLKLSYRFLANSSILSELEMGAGDSLGSFLLNDFNIELKTSLKDFFPNLNSVFVPHWVYYKGTRFDKFSTVVVDIDQHFGYPIFAEIISIFVSEKTVVISCLILETLGFNEHFHAYEVKKTQTQKCYDLESLVDPLPLNIVTCTKGDFYIVLRYQI